MKSMTHLKILHGSAWCLDARAKAEDRASKYTQREWQQALAEGLPVEMNALLHHMQKKDLLLRRHLGEVDLIVATRVQRTIEILRPFS
jgi:hypothetical protein